jgi:RNA polymerase sigma factor (sigma-70 family)
MDHTKAADPALLGHYEGLVRKTAARYVGLTLHDFEDICQVFRVKVWKALLAWDPTDHRILAKIAKGETEDDLRDRFVFMCLRNQGKDLVKRRKPETDPLFIEDFSHGDGHTGIHDHRESTSRDWFESRFLCATEEEVFGEINGEDILLPPCLSQDERRVLVCMYLDLTHAEIQLRLGLSAKQVSAAKRGLKENLQHLKPPEQAEFELAAVA